MKKLLIVILMLLAIPIAAQAVSATGGNSTNSYTEGGTNFTAHIFTNSGTFAVSATGTVDFLIVAGGGAGGRSGVQAGGGGAGGLIYSNAFVVAISNYAVVVGTSVVGRTTSGAGNHGADSSFGGSTATGGGGGGGGTVDATSGGSGGGGANNYAAGTGTLGQGNAGGTAPVEYGGGGGGAGSVGKNGSAALGGSGGGGTGLAYNISGTLLYYAGGGGGYSATHTSGAGGLGGGGAGAASGGDGTNGFGGGGGAGNTISGAGGSGIVIVRYVTGGESPSTNTYTITYGSNNETSGTVPSSQIKTQDVTLVLATNVGNLARTGYTFSGWNTATNGSGTSYAEGANYSDNASATLYAKWTLINTNTTNYVIFISIDGAGSAYITNYVKGTAGAQELTTLAWMRDHGASTFNARNDPDMAITLPEHTGMVTGRGALNSYGHGWTSNGDPGAGTIQGNKGSYVFSVFDVTAAAGVSAGLWASKNKFVLFPNSYAGLMVATSIVDGASAATVTASFTNRMATSLVRYSFIHFQDPDAAGHNYGWGSSAYQDALKSVDNSVAAIIAFVTNNTAMAANTTIIVSADHGGHDTGHGVTNNALDYTVPFLAWGRTVQSGVDLYAINSTVRGDPSTNTPYYVTVPQPIRNEDQANLSMYLLGLSGITGAVANASQDLRLSGLSGASSAPRYSWEPNQCFAPNDAIKDGESAQ